jgi:hypothetical protein
MTANLTLPPCRTDTDAFLNGSGYYRKGVRWSHYPLLVFKQTADGIEVQILTSVAQVNQSTLPDESRCLQQWGGEWRSDWFTFTLGEARAALASHR